MRRVVALPAAGLLVLGVGTTEAAGAPPTLPVTLVITTPDAVVWGRCFDYHWSYDLDQPTDDLSWALELVFHAPDGQRFGGGDYGETSSISFWTQQWCPAHPVGHWRVTGVFRWTSADGSHHAAALPETAFDLRPRLTRTRVRVVRAAPRGGATVRVRSRQERRVGYAADAGAVVHLQRLRHGEWRRVPGTRKVTDERGVAVVRLRAPRTTRLRAVTRAEEGADRSVSSVVRVGPPAYDAVGVPGG